MARLWVPPHPSASPPPAASHLQARPCQVNSCSPRSKAPQTPALPTTAKATSHPSPCVGPKGRERLVNHKETASGQPWRQAEETRAGRELPTRPQERSGLPTLTQCRIHQPVACLPVPRESLRASQPGLWPGNLERQADASVQWGIGGGLRGQNVGVLVLCLASGRLCDLWQVDFFFLPQGLCFCKLGTELWLYLHVRPRISPHSAGRAPTDSYSPSLEPQKSQLWSLAPTDSPANGYFGAIMVFLKLCM